MIAGGRRGGYALGLMSDVTRLLNAIGHGDAAAAGRLLPLVYEELRRLAALRLAQEKPGQTLQATALVHEAYLRLVGKGDEQPWNGRGHFFAAAAEAMRRILVEHARRKGRRQRPEVVGDHRLQLVAEGSHRGHRRQDGVAGVAGVVVRLACPASRAKLSNPRPRSLRRRPA
jgi:RNA polymerase sigma factor (TIGR02999 family)